MMNLQRYFEAGRKRGLPFSFGNALAFDGVNDFLQSENNVVQLNNATKVTMSVWVKTLNNNSDFMIGIINAPVGDTGFYIMSVGENILYTQIRVGDVFNNITDFSFANKNNIWHNIVMVYDGDLSGTNVVNCYINGVVVGYTQKQTTASVLSGTIGNFPLYFNGVFNRNKEMLVSDFGIKVGVAATPEEAVMLYNNGLGLPFNQVFQNPDMYIPFNEINGIVASDLSANENHLNLTNFNVDECPFDGSNTCPWKPFNP